MKREHSGNNSGRTIVKILILVTLTALLLSACDGGSIGSGTMKDPYEAYGVERGELAFPMMDDPPKAITIQPYLLRKAWHADVMLDVEPMTFEKGTTLSFNFDLEVIRDEGGAYPLSGTVEMTYLRNDADDMFSIDTDTYGYVTLVRGGLYYNELGQHTTTGGGTHFARIGDSDDYLTFALGVDKKDADKADGNVAIIYCKVLSVRR